jgi:hypothetical protein
MGRKDTTTTPRSQVKSGMRNIWMRSRERGTAMKLAKRACSCCGAKKVVATPDVRLEVYHDNGINWDGVVDLFFERVLQRPEDYTVLCKECHLEEHKEEKV